MDINAIILTAKLGKSRKDAQEDTCTVFAAALYDVLIKCGISCKMVTAIKSGMNAWAHSVVDVDGKYYDSRGKFSIESYRSLAKINPKVVLDIKFQPDSRSECYEPDFDELYDFYVKMLNRAICNHKEPNLCQ
jgi:hypothetical protein